MGRRHARRLLQRARRWPLPDRGARLRPAGGGVRDAGLRDFRGAAAPDYRRIQEALVAACPENDVNVMWAIKSNRRLALRKVLEPGGGGWGLLRSRRDPRHLRHRRGSGALRAERVGPIRGGLSHGHRHRSAHHPRPPRRPRDRRTAGPRAGQAGPRPDPGQVRAAEPGRRALDLRARHHGSLRGAQREVRCDLRRGRRDRQGGPRSWSASRSRGFIPTSAATSICPSTGGATPATWSTSASASRTTPG